jgi:hypothetical protein
MHPCIIEDIDFWHLVKCYYPYFIEYWNEFFLDDDEQIILNHLLWFHNYVYTEQILLTFSGFLVSFNMAVVYCVTSVALFF